MAQKFNIVAQLNIQGPANLKQTVAKIQRQLQGVSANVNVKINTPISKRRELKIYSIRKVSFNTSK